ncbi:unnamed protein product [Arctia plantaginis]|uniref:Uncharacterized protein n=1 Tax=Arctia plantaginis TaxID=874455 RepID=A0A8S0YZW7_ARCPL|nr:unnamed protein product [Arctia plantaginis]
MVYVISGIAQKKKLIELSYALPCVTICWLGNTKIVPVIANEKSIDLLINNIRQFETEQKNRPIDLEVDKIIKEEDDYLNKTIRVLYIFYIVLLASFPFIPLVLMLLKYLETNEVELILPFLVVYPFDAFDIKYYPYVYLRQIWSG